MRGITKSDILAILVIILMALISYSSFIFHGNLINSDSWKNYYPWRADYDKSQIKTNYLDPNVEYGIWFPFAKEEIAQGRFPHWNPYSFCGTPLYANHLVPVFHLPFSISLLWSPQKVATVYSLIMAFCGALFFYLFLRNWKLNPSISLFGASMYLFSGWMVLTHPPEVTVLMWMPAILLFHDRFIEKGRFTDVALCAFCVGQLLIAGYPAYIVQFFYLALIYVLWRRFHPSFDIRINLSKWIVGVLLIVFLGGLMSAVQNYPLFEYIKNSNRTLSTYKEGIEPIESVVERSKQLAEDVGVLNVVKTIAWKQIFEKASFMMPEFMWNRGRFYVGPVVFLLAIFGLFILDRRFRVLKILLVILAFLVIVPHVTNIVSKYLPGWGITPTRPTQIFLFLLFFLASLSLDELLRMNTKSRVCFIIGVLMLILLFILPRLHPLYILHPFEQVFRWNPTTDILFFTIHITIAAFLVLVLTLKSVGIARRSFWTILFIALFVIFNPVTYSYLHMHFYSRNPMPLNDDIEKMMEIVKDGRIARFGTSDVIVSMVERIDATFPPNIPGKFGIYDIQGYDSMTLKDYAHFLSLVNPEALFTGRGVKRFSKVEDFRKNGLLTHGAGLRYIITDGNLPDMTLAPYLGNPIYTGRLKIFKLNNESDAFIRFTSQYDIIDFQTDVKELNPYRILLEKKPIFPNGQELKSSIDMDLTEVPEEWENFTPEIIKRNPTEVEMRFTVPSDGLIYISDTWHPNWKARIDGLGTEILKANYSFRAIAVPKGEHTLRMWYDGIEVVSGGVVSLIGLLLAFGISLLDIKRKRVERNL